MYPIAELVPHSGRMLLIDGVDAVGDDWVTCHVHIHENSMFLEDQGVSTLVAIEYMAQSIAALAGIRAKKNGDAVRIGLLLGTRTFKSNNSYFPLGSTVSIRVEEVFFETDGLAVFKCQAKSGDIEATCQLNVFHPKNIETVLS